MPLQNIDHINVRTKNLRETREFYVDVLGLREGDRPPFPFPGLWIYLGDQAVLHFVEADADSGLKAYLGDQPQSGGGGVVDHVAFAATGLADMVERLEGRGVKILHRKVPLRGLHQIFFHDPNGLKIELIYSATEGEAFPAA